MEKSSIELIRYLNYKRTFITDGFSFDLYTVYLLPITVWSTCNKEMRWSELHIAFAAHLHYLKRVDKWKFSNKPDQESAIAPKSCS